MPSFKSLLLSAALASAHVSLENPKPYKLVADGRTNPVSPTGSDFPCRIPPGQSYIIDGEPTPMVIGEDQTLSFSGQAVHGGGSCQVALSRGFPTKESPWMVIHSIEGGCPARNQKGNLEGPNEDTYTFRIPEGIEPGTNWTLSWTWVSRIGGGPEFYQNCAPITILASNKKRMSLPARRDALSKRHDDFPELFMANMGEVSGGCTTSDAQREQLSIAYPNPGSSVERPEGDHLFKQMCDGNPRAKTAPAAGGSDNDGETNTPPAVASPPCPGPSSPSSAGSVSSSTASSRSASTSAAAAETTPTTLTTATPTTPTSTMPDASAGAGNPYSSAPPASDGQCVEGQLTCLDDGTHFATCTGGQLTAHQPIAPGYQCKPGSGLGLEISPL